MKLVWFTVALIVVLVVLLPAFLGVGIRKIPSGFQPPLSNSQQLAGENMVSQTFTTQKNRLSGFALTIKNSNLINKKNITMSLTQNGSRVRQVTLSGKNIPDGGYINFSFDPIIDSGSQTYTASFSAPDAMPEDALELYHSDQPFNGEYRVNGVTHPGSLSFINYYAPENVFAIWLTIYGNWLWKFFQDLPFAIIYLGFIILIIGYLFLCRNTHQA